MSYTLFYDKQFIKAGEDAFIPVILMGDNNVYEYGHGGRNGRRSRDWEGFRFDRRTVYSSGEMLTEVEEIRKQLIDRNRKNNEYYVKEGRPDWQDVYDDARFGYFAGLAIGGSTRNTTFGDYKGVFVTGMKKALTVEQLKEHGLTVYIHMFEWGTEYKDKAKELGIEWLGSTTITSTQHLLDTIAKYELTYAQHRDKFSFYIGFEQSTRHVESIVKRIRKTLFPKKKTEHVYVSVDHYYTVKVTHMWGDYKDQQDYFVKRTRSGYRFSRYNPHHKFLTEKQAEAFKKKMARHLTLTVVRIDEQTSIRIPVK